MHDRDCSESLQNFIRNTLRSPKTQNNSKGCALWPLRLNEIFNTTWPLQTCRLQQCTRMLKNHKKRSLKVWRNQAHTLTLSTDVSDVETLKSADSDTGEHNQSHIPEKSSCYSDHYSTCSSEYCNDRLEPYCPQITYSATKQKQGKQCQSFQSAWFHEHKCLLYVWQVTKFLSLLPCTSIKGLINPIKKSKHAFVSSGFNNWKGKRAT